MLRPLTVNRRTKPCSGSRSLPPHGRGARRACSVCPAAFRKGEEAEGVLLLLQSVSTLCLYKTPCLLCSEYPISPDTLPSVLYVRCTLHGCPFGSVPLLWLARAVCCIVRTNLLPAIPTRGRGADADPLLERGASTLICVFSARSSPRATPLRPTEWSSTQF